MAILQSLLHTYLKLAHVWLLCGSDPRPSIREASIWLYWYLAIMYILKFQMIRKIIQKCLIISESGSQPNFILNCNWEMFILYKSLEIINLDKSIKIVILRILSSHLSPGIKLQQDRALLLTGKLGWQEVHPLLYCLVTVGAGQVGLGSWGDPATRTASS